MKIDFPNTEEVNIPNFKGGEGVFAVKTYLDEANRIMEFRLLPGSSIGMHRHVGNSEVIRVLSGEGYVLYEGEKIALKAGDVHYCPEGHEHSLVNPADASEDLCCFAVVANRQ